MGWCSSDGSFRSVYSAGDCGVFGEKLSAVVARSVGFLAMVLGFVGSTQSVDLSDVVGLVGVIVVSSHIYEGTSAGSAQSEELGFGVISLACASHKVGLLFGISGE